MIMSFRILWWKLITENCIEDIHTQIYQIEYAILIYIRYLKLHGSVVHSTNLASVHLIHRYFFIKSELHGKVLDVAGESKQPGTMVIMWPQKSPPASNQLWYLDDNGFIRSKLTNFCLQPSGTFYKCCNIFPK